MNYLNIRKLAISILIINYILLFTYVFIFTKCLLTEIYKLYISVSMHIYNIIISVTRGGLALQNILH